MEKCELCNKEFKTVKSLSAHLITHNLTSKEYYDKFILVDGGDECDVCGKKTTYRNINIGYLNNCSMGCRNKNKNIKHDYWKGKKQPIEIIEKRIDKTNQITKEEKRKKTMLEKYGVNNPSKLPEIKNKISIGNKGRIVKKDKKWLNKIIETKKKNGTLTHSEETKKKIKNSLNEYYKNCLDREKYISVSNNVNHLSGWYNGLYFRSSLELSFLVNNSDKNFITCENNKFKVIYDIDEKTKAYYPDFTDGLMIYEIKPSSLLKYKDNQIKIKRGYEVYGDNFKVITENESPYIKKEIIADLIDSGLVIITENSKEILKKYKI